MAKVLGIGGVFFKAQDPAALGAWYARVLGLELQGWGGVLFAPLPHGHTVGRRSGRTATISRRRPSPSWSI